MWNQACRAIVLDQKACHNVSPTLDIAKGGRFERLLIDIKGTHSASVAITDIGWILANIVGRNVPCLANAEAHNLGTFGNWNKGFLTNTAGTTFRFLIPIPVQMPGHPNALHVGAHDITVQIPNMAVDVATATLLGVPSNEPENYCLHTQQRTRALTGGDPLVVDEKDICILALFDAETTNPVMVVVSQDNYKVNECEYDRLSEISDWLGMVEAAALPMGCITFFDQDMASVLAQNVACQCTGGAGDMDYFVISAAFDRARAEMTQDQKVHMMIAKMVDRQTSIDISPALRPIAERSGGAMERMPSATAAGVRRGGSIRGG